MARDRVQELGENRGIEVAGPVLNHAQAEMDVAEKPALLGLAEGRAAAELADAADVVEQCCGEQEIGAEARMELRCLAAERRDADGVLDEASGVTVMPVGPGRRQRAKRRPDVGVGDERAHDRSEAGVCDLGGEELEEAVELVRVAPKSRRQRRWVGVLGGLDRAHLHLELAVEALDPSEDPDGVALAEAAVEEVDVRPDSRVDAAARVGELEREVGGARARPAAFLLRDREDALDRPVLRELGDRGHGRSLRLGTDWLGVATLQRQTPACPPDGPVGVGRLGDPMAALQPFRAVRYSGAAGPLADLVAPPYDAVTPAERDELFLRSPYNVVRLTLPESAEDAGRLYREWVEEGILARDDEPAFWLLVDEYVGPDGVARERRGVVASVLAEPYAAGGVLPHERTHPEIRQERLRLLRETRAQPEPILLLHEGKLTARSPERDPDLFADGSRAWRLDDAAFLDGGALLIADGHHRYESAIALGEELGGDGARIMALVVSTGDPGLHVFPTHRVFTGRPDLARSVSDQRFDTLDGALRELAGLPFGRSAAVAYCAGSVELLTGEEDELDVELVDRVGLEGISYTPDVVAAVGAVDRGEADAAFLLRRPRVEDVFAAARRGERMPPKSTYFFPKPLSGLLFHPVQP